MRTDKAEGDTSGLVHRPVCGDVAVQQFVVRCPVLSTGTTCELIEEEEEGGRMEHDGVLHDGCVHRQCL